VRNDSSRVDALHRLAVLHDGKGEFETSEEFYRAALSQDPNNAELLCDWGYRCYLHRDFQQAEACLRKALSLKNGFARAHNNLGLLLGRTGRCDEALDEFARAGCSEPGARSEPGRQTGGGARTVRAGPAGWFDVQRSPRGTSCPEGRRFGGTLGDAGACHCPSLPAEPAYGIRLVPARSRLPGGCGRGRAVAEPGRPNTTSSARPGGSGAAVSCNSRRSAMGTVAKVT
jgi:tetratricopeptide (TPR) repeat protein